MPDDPKPSAPESDPTSKPAKGKRRSEPAPKPDEGKPVDPPKPETAKLSKTWPELIDKQFGGMKRLVFFTLGGGAVLGIGANTELRKLAGEVWRNGSLRLKKPLNWSLNHFQGCLLALFQAAVVNFLVLCPLAIYVAMECHNPGVKAVLEAVITILFVVGAFAPMMIWTPYLVRLSLLQGGFESLTPEEGEEFFNRDFFGIVFGAAPPALKAMKDMILGLVYKIGRVLTFVVTGFLAFSIFPWDRVPGILLIVPVVGILFAVLHGLWPQKDQDGKPARGYEWHYLNSAALYVVGILILLSAAPFALSYLSIPMDNNWGVIRSVLMVGLYIMLHKQIQSNAQKSFDAQSEDAGGKKAAKPATKNGNAFGDLAMAVLGLAVVGMVVLGASMAWTAFSRGTNGFTRVNTGSSFWSKLQLNAFPPTTRGADAIGLTGTAQAATLVVPTLTPSRTATITSCDYSFTAQLGDITPDKPPVVLAAGDTFVVEVKAGTYTYQQRSYTTAGLLDSNNQPLTPVSIAGQLSAADYQGFPDSQLPIGALLVRKGPNTPWVMIDGKALVSETAGVLTFIFNLPQHGPRYTSSERIVVNITVRHPIN